MSSCFPDLIGDGVAVEYEDLVLRLYLSYGIGIEAPPVKRYLTPCQCAREDAQQSATCRCDQVIWPTLYLDATGEGTTVVDVKDAGVPARLVPVYFTHGDRRTVVEDEVRLGKAWLVSRMQALLQGGLLHLPRTPEAGQLGRELLDYEIRVSEDANGRYGAFWRCRFWSYEERGGMRVPLDGEAAWLPPEGKKSYFRGRITEIVYEFPR